MTIKTNKRASSLLYQILIQLILIALIFSLFFVSISYQANSKAIRQQIIEKQTALLIDSSMPGTTLILKKINLNGRISNFKIENATVFAYIGDNTYTKGYGFFTKYNVELEVKEDKYIITIK